MEETADVIPEEVAVSAEVPANSEVGSNAARKSQAVSPTVSQGGDQMPAEEQTLQVEEPRMSQAQELRMSQAQEPRMSQAQEPRMSQAQEPRMSQAQEPRMSQPQEPRMSQAQEPRMSQAQEPRMSQAQEPRMSQAQEPRMSQMEQPRMSQMEQPRMSQMEQPRMSQTQDQEPRMSQERRTSQEPRASQVQEPRASQAQEPRASQAQEPRASQAQEPRGSQVPRASQAQAPRGSQAPRASQAQERKESHDTAQTISQITEEGLAQISELSGERTPSAEMPIRYSITKDTDAAPKSSLLMMEEPEQFKRPKIDRSALIEELMQTFTQTRSALEQKIEVLECLDISITVAAFKIFEATNEFKEKIAEVKKERWQLLTSLSHRSELSLILNDLDKRISDFERELDAKIMFLNQQKISHQEDMENLMPELDTDLATLKDVFEKIEDAINDTLGTNYRMQIALLNEQYNDWLIQFEAEIAEFERIQVTSWKVEQSEVKLTEMLQDQGLTFTASGRLLTRKGSRITFEEAQEKGYFRDLQLPLERFLAFSKQELPSILSESELSSAMTFADKMSSEEVKYLKQNVGKVLTLALAEITAKQPRDPIHYLGHYLFKYRYNQELEDIQKCEVDELTKQREALARERWHKFVEEEARHAVIQMVIRAEEIGMMNELKRIEEEQKRAEAEEEEMDEALLEEARDTFE